MPSHASAVLVAAGISWLAVMGLACLESACNGEQRAARVSLLLAGVGAAALFLITLLPAQVQLASVGLLGLGFVSAAALFVLPVGQVADRIETPRSRYDERDIAFARARLEPGTDDYEAYYRARRYMLEGHDPVDLTLQTAREIGLAFFLSYRMNEIHYVAYPDCPTHSRFWREHPEYRIRPGAAPLNCLVPAVRERYLDLLSELVPL